MSEHEYNGYGPPGARYPYMILVHGINSTPMGTELHLILDDSNWIARLEVSFPPEDNEWRSKFLTTIEPGEHPLRTASVIVPPGHAVLSLRVSDAAGNPIPELCCAYRLIQNDWLKEAVQDSQVAELMDGDEEPYVEKSWDERTRDEQSEMDSRLFIAGPSFNCCLCGTIKSEKDGYHFEDLSSDQVRAIRLMSTVSEEFPFVCKTCYSAKVGLTRQAIGSATWFQGMFTALLLIVVRGYLGAYVAIKYFGVKKLEHIYVSAFLGSLVPFEALPAVLAQVARNPLVMMMIFFVPVVFGALWLIRPDLLAILMGTNDEYVGPRQRLFDLKLLAKTIYGSGVGFVLGLVFGTVDTGNEKKPGKAKAY